MSKKLSVLVIDDSVDDFLLVQHELKKGGFSERWHCTLKMRLTSCQDIHATKK